MTGTTSAIKLASNALILLGAEPISSFTDGSTGATIASNLYENSYLSLLTSHRWRFSVKQEKLARLTGDTGNSFTYMYQLPSDCMYLIQVDTFTYEVYEDKLYCNVTEVLADYVFRVDEDRLPPYFSKMFEFYLASQFAVALTGDLEKAELFSTFYMNELKRAKFADSTQTPQVSFVDSPYISIRY